MVVRHICNYMCVMLYLLNDLIRAHAVWVTPISMVYALNTKCACHALNRPDTRSLPSLCVSCSVLAGPRSCVSVVTIYTPEITCGLLGGQHACVLLGDQHVFPRFGVIVAPLCVHVHIQSNVSSYRAVECQVV